jgi:hypothetical protein
MMLTAMMGFEALAASGPEISRLKLQERSEKIKKTPHKIAFGFKNFPG